MALEVGSILQFAVGGVIYGQRVMNVWHYEIATQQGTPNIVNYAEAWWNHVKDEYRAIPAAQYDTAFLNIHAVEADNLTGEAGDFPIPAGERAGTRSNQSTTFSPSFLAAGAKLNVATRATRSGQKRFYGLVEADVTDGILQSAVVTAIGALLSVMTSTLTLGAPALGGGLRCVVARKDAVSGLVTATQNVTGFSVNPQVTTQNTRKIGRGV